MSLLIEQRTRAPHPLPACPPDHLFPWPHSPNGMAAFMVVWLFGQEENELSITYQEIGDRVYAHLKDRGGRRRKAIRAVQELVDGGLLVKRMRTLEDGTWVANLYSVTEYAVSGYRPRATLPWEEPAGAYEKEQAARAGEPEQEAVEERYDHVEAAALDKHVSDCGDHWLH